MTDRELLELAAKAAGDGIVFYGECWRAQSGREWNPLLDDGDALRLAVKLNLWLHVEEYGASARRAGGAWLGCEAHLHGGIEVATRRAIVRAAAAIGKEM
jgi:hypothetical protein